MSLKNVYMLLMTDDFPIYSESVVSKADRKGQTLLRFWQRLIAEEFRSLPYGKMIWRDDDKRNRYTSYLCNRSAELRCYQEYAKELSSQISTAALLSQINRFMEFLSARKYKQDVLLRRVRELVRLTESEDPRVSREIAQQIQTAAVPALQEGGSRGELFQAGYLLTLLTLYAAAGEAMEDAPMAVLRGEGYSLEKLWQSCTREQEHSMPVTFLTVRCAMLQDNLLSRDRFFGREEELYDLREMVAARSKCLISGIGGIGKTELLRQLLHRCEKEGAADQIAVIPYVSGIIESFARAFPGFRRQEPEEEFHRILYQIEKSAEQGSRILLLIDDVDRVVEEDPALARLKSLPCSILITTRQHALEGFQVYRIQPPVVSAGMLIFRDNYGRVLTGENRAVLTDMLADEALCHPATLRLMARAARSKEWSVEELKCRLEKNGIALTWQEGDRTVRLSQMYRQLYSYMHIPKEYQTLAELFTLLPRASYTAAFLREAFPGIAGEISLEQGLAALAAGGWLEDDGSGCSMHPLIAQCLRRRHLTEERLEPVLGHIRDMLLREEMAVWLEERKEEIQRMCDIFVSVCRILTGSISRELMLGILSALLIVFPTRQDAEEYQCWLGQMMKRCPGKDDQIEVLLCEVLGRLELGDTLRFEVVYRRQKERLTVPLPMFLDFCLYVGAALACRREFELAELLLREGLCDAASPFQKALAYYRLEELCETQGNWEGLQRWSQEGAEYVTAHPECGKHVMFSNLCERCMVHVRCGQKEAAEPLMKNIQSLLQKDFPGEWKLTYEGLAGAYELTFGSMEQALTHYSECLEQALQYHGRNIGYYSVLGQVAIVLQRLKRYEEAIPVYGTILEYAQESGDMNMLQRFSNNLAVLYLDLGKPEEALLHLPVALEEGRKLGGIALAEALRNMARAHGLSGNTVLEYRYYQEAAPLLEEVYGPEHPRTAEAEARLAELEKQQAHSGT